MIIKVEIDLKGHFCNQWPVVEIYHQDHLLASKSVEDTINLSFELDCTDHSRVRLRQIDKRFGDGNVWDTYSDGSQDRYITIMDVRFDKVSMGQRMINNLKFHTEWNDLQLQQNDRSFIQTYSQFPCNGMMRFNGYVDICFMLPIFNWLTIAKYKTTQPGNSSYFSGHSSNWHYEEDIAILQEIKALMKF